MTAEREVIFLPVNIDINQENFAANPPDNLQIQSPPHFTDFELGYNNDNKWSKKPPNAFILFRKKYVDSLQRLGRRDEMKSVSGWVAKAWKNLPQEERDHYVKFAERASDFYRSNPKPKNGGIKKTYNKNNKKVRGKKNVLPEIPEIPETNLINPINQVPDYVPDYYTYCYYNSMLVLSDLWLF
jgi:hypothetical protein